MLPPVLQTVFEEVTQRLQTTPPCVWVHDEPTKEDLDHILKEGSTPSEFDSNNLRKEMLDALRAKRATLLTRTSKYAKVLAVVYPEQEARIPWDLFGKIFQAFGPCARSKGSWRFVWFANPAPRLLPTPQTPVAAEHMNGGYTYPCDPSAIVVYREEEVARVLVHEMLHAACTDSPKDMLEIKEAKTETWAEIFLVAILAAGKPRIFSNLWRIQAQWIADQEAVLMRDHGVRGPEDYAWRYTLGRRFVLEGLGCGLPMPAAAVVSLRFTSPELQLAAKN
jgi:hypothetical protein